MAKNGWVGKAEQAIESVLMVTDELLEPNPWNPNVMTPEIFEKERASIREFGFVDPLTVRWIGDRYQIIDGEHRWKAGRLEGYRTFPVVLLRDIDDETAKQLTIVLNETRGSPDKGKLAALVRDLAAKRDQAQLQRVLPYTAEQMRSMVTGMDQIDWDSLHQKRDQLKQDRERWVERVFRMPAEAAQVVDDAIERVKTQEGIETDWRALEMIAADSMAG